MRILSGLTVTTGILFLVPAGSSPPHAAAPQGAPGLVGYWRLDETAVGLVEDLSPAENHGVHFNAPVPDPGDVASPPGGWGFPNPGSLSLDAAIAQQYVRIPDDPSLRIAGPLTLAAWVKPTADTGLGDPVEAQKCIIDKWFWPAGFVGPLDGFVLRLSWGSLGNNVPGFIVGDGTTQVTLGTGVALPLNVWAHVAGVYDGTNMILYVNGTVGAITPSTTSPTVANTRDLHVGADYGSNTITGNLDEVRVYGRALTPLEVANLANGLNVGALGPGFIIAAEPPPKAAGYCGSLGIDLLCPLAVLWLWRRRRRRSVE